MRAVDTNVVVRYLMVDDLPQAMRAKAAVDDGVWLSTTVLLETEWVLRNGFHLTATEIVRALRRFIGLPTVSLERPELAAQALAWSEAGMDFADALHLAAAEGRDAFLTFDKDLIRAARGQDAIAVKAP